MDNNIEIIKLLQEQMKLMRKFFNNEMMLLASEMRRKVPVHEIEFHNKKFNPELSNYDTHVHQMSEAHHVIAGKMDEVDKKIAELIKTGEENETLIETKKDPVLPFFDFGEYP